MELERVSVMALRTVPVKLKNRNKELVVNASLDDASTTTYINCDVAEELELQGPLETVSISIMNGNVKTYQTMPVARELLSCGGTLKHYILGYTTYKTTLNMNPTEWKSQCKRMASSQKSAISKTGYLSNHRYSNCCRSSRPP